ncbi:HD domain-containing protein [Antarcticibacterium arcticum]|uniref:HD domain-containing protein n=1 Tax=Antarcticibacterium arcticum TaxID=2585771 RepID=A0A5B8YMV5_9FLAO|nr:HD domain-containing protein [Antarcticibacterium arcticum]
MNMSIFNEIYSKVIGALEKDLPEWLTYHNAAHTQYVLEQAEKIAVQENISGRNLLLVKIAALYHDAGFLIDHENHEELGCDLASRELLGTQLTRAEIDTVCGMIQATNIPQKPTNILEKIVADADLEYLGTENFKKFGDNLYREMLHFNPKLSPKEWDNIQIDFLSRHSYHTNFCRKNREPMKQLNLNSVKERYLVWPNK